MKLTFGDIVIVEKSLLGVVVKSWDKRLSKYEKQGYYHEVYVRSWNCIKEYHEDDLDRYIVRHKELSEEEYDYQYNH